MVSDLCGLCCDCEDRSKLLLFVLCSKLIKLLRRISSIVTYQIGMISQVQAPNIGLVLLYSICKVKDSVNVSKKIEF